MQYRSLRGSTTTTTPSSDLNPCEEPEVQTFLAGWILQPLLDVSKEVVMVALLSLWNSPVRDKAKDCPVELVVEKAQGSSPLKAP